MLVWTALNRCSLTDSPVIFSTLQVRSSMDTEHVRYLAHAARRTCRYRLRTCAVTFVFVEPERSLAAQTRPYKTSQAFHRVELHMCKLPFERFAMQLRFT